MYILTKEMISGVSRVQLYLQIAMLCADEYICV